MKKRFPSRNFGKQFQGIISDSIYIIVLTTLAFGINIWGIKKNLPYIPEFDEKRFWVGRAVTMAHTNSANPEWFGHPGSTILYPLTILYNLKYGDQVQSKFDEEPSEFYLDGRLLVSLYSSLSIPIIYLIGKKIFSKSTGIIGALYFIFVPTVVYYAQIVRTDTAAIFFGTLSLWMIIKIYENPSIKKQLLAGLFIGLSIASRYFMISLIPALCYVNLKNINKSKRKRHLQILAIVGIVSILIVFILSTPYFVLDFHTALESIKTEARSTHLGADGLSPIGNFWWYISEVIPSQITSIRYFLFITGLILVVLRKNTKALVLLISAGTFLVGISLLSLHWKRWVIPILPVITLLAAYALDALSKNLSQNEKRQYIIFTFLCIISLSLPVYKTVLHCVRSSRPSTRILAREWINENIPYGSQIAQEYYTAPLDDTNYLILEKFSLSKYNIDYYHGEGYEYLVISSNIYNRYYKEPNRYSKEVNFYNSLIECNCLIQEFIGSSLQGGPTIRIYNIDLKP